MIVPSDVDCDKYSLEELIAGLVEGAPTVARFLKSDVARKGVKGQFHDEIIALVREGGAFSVYNYIIAHATDKQKILTTDMTMVAAARNYPMASCTSSVVGTYLWEDEDEILAELAVKISKTKEPDANWIEPIKVETPVETLLFGVDNVAYVAPLVKGEPLISATMEKQLLESGIEVERPNPPEIRASQAIVDLVVHKEKEGLTPKIHSSKVPVFAGRERERDQLVALTISILGPLFLTGQSCKGRELYRRLLRAMITARKDSKQIAGYTRLMAAWAKWLESPPSFNKPKAIGDYKPDTIEYSRALLSAMRGVRGGDDNDSTAVGYSSYLPFNVPRNVAKSLVRSIDVTRLLQHFNTGAITIMGKHAQSFIDSLIMCSPAMLKVIYGPISTYAGWDETSAGVFCSAHHDFTIITSSPPNDTLVLDTSYVSSKHIRQTNELVSSQHVHIVDVPRDWQNGRFMPSAAAHNLVGFLLPEFLPWGETDNDTTPLYDIEENYLKCADAINISRTYPGHYQHRASVICERFGLPVIPVRALWTYVKKMQVIGMTAIDIGPVSPVNDFAEFMAEDQVQEIATKISAMLTRDKGKKELIEIDVEEPDVPDQIDTVRKMTKCKGTSQKSLDDNFM